MKHLTPLALLAALAQPAASQAYRADNCGNTMFQTQVLEDGLTVALIILNPGPAGMSYSVELPGVAGLRPFPTAPVWVSPRQPGQVRLGRAEQPELPNSATALTLRIDRVIRITCRIG